jgi:hypothetical protein
VSSKPVQAHSSDGLGCKCMQINQKLMVIAPTVGVNSTLNLKLPDISNQKFRLRFHHLPGDFFIG